MNIESITILDRKNQPVFFSNFLAPTFNDAECQAQVYMSLDFLFEKAKGNKYGDPFLGLYYFLDHKNFYGYCSASNLKVILVLNWTDLPPKDTLLRSILMRIHEEYVGFTLNPFHAGLELDEKETHGLKGKLQQIKIVEKTE